MEEAFLVPVSRKAGLVRRPLPDLPGRPAAADAQHALAVGAPYAPRAAKHRAPEPPRARNDDVAPPPAARRDDDDDEKPHRRLHVASARTTARRGARPAASEGATAERVVSGGEHGFLQCDAEDVWFPHAALYVDRLRTRATWRERGGTLDLADWRLEDADLALVATECAKVAALSKADGITVLTLRACDRITSGGLSHLVHFEWCTHLDLSHCALVDDAACEHLRRHFRQVEKLDLSETRVADAGVRAVLAGMRRLQDVSVRGTGVNNAGLKEMADAATKYRALTALDLRRCEAFSNDALLVLLSGCGGMLQGLRLAGCRQVDAAGLLGLRRTGQLELRSLDLAGCVKVRGALLLGALGDSACHLVELRLSGLSAAVDDAALQLFADASEAAPPLKLLDISRCVSVTVSSLLGALKRVKKTLTDLDVSYCCLLDDGLGDALRPLRRLTKLKMVDTPLISDAGFERVFSGKEAYVETCDEDSCDEVHELGDVLTPAQRRRRKLKLLAPEELEEASRALARAKRRQRVRPPRRAAPQHPLRDVLASAALTGAVDGSSRCRVPRFGEGALRALARHCGGDLRRVDVDGAPRVNDAALLALAATCPQLRKLGVDGCSRVTDVGVAAVARNCALLERLRAGGCGGTTKPLTDESGMALGLLVFLKTCDLSRSRVGVEGLLAMARGCASLEVLRLVGCDDVTDAGVAALLARCKRLHTLNLHGCDFVTPAIFAAFDATQRQRPPAEAHEGRWRPSSVTASTRPPDSDGGAVAGVDGAAEGDVARWWRFEAAVLANLDLRRAGAGFDRAVLERAALTLPFAAGADGRPVSQGGHARGLTAVAPCVHKFAAFQLCRRTENAAATAAQRRARGNCGRAAFRSVRALDARRRELRAAAEVMQCLVRSALACLRVAALRRQQFERRSLEASKEAEEQQALAKHLRSLAKAQRQEWRRRCRAGLVPAVETFRRGHLRLRAAAWRRVAYFARYALRLQKWLRRRRRFRFRAAAAVDVAARRVARFVRRWVRTQWMLLQRQLADLEAELAFEATAPSRPAAGDGAADGALKPAADGAATTSPPPVATAQATARKTARGEMKALLKSKQEHAAQVLRAALWAQRRLRFLQKRRREHRAAFSIQQAHRARQCRKLLRAKKCRFQKLLRRWEVLCGADAAAFVAKARHQRERALQARALEALRDDQDRMRDAAEFLRKFLRSDPVRAWRAALRRQGVRRQRAAFGFQCLWRRYVAATAAWREVRREACAALVLTLGVLHWIARHRAAKLLRRRLAEARARAAEADEAFKRSKREERASRLLAKCFQRGREKSIICIQVLWRARCAGAVLRAVGAADREARLRGLRRDYAMSVKATEAKAATQRLLMQGTVALQKLAKTAASAVVWTAKAAAAAAARYAAGESEEDATRRAHGLPPLLRTTPQQRLMRHLRGAPSQQELEQRAQLTNSILNSQTRSAQPRGVVALKLTVGRKELVAMNEKQAWNKQAKLQVFVRIKKDISANKKKVFLWVAEGTDPLVFTGVAVRGVPANHADVTANQARIFDAAMGGSAICSHVSLQTEFVGTVGVLRGDPAPPVIAVDFSLDEKEEEALRLRDFEVVPTALGSRRKLRGGGADKFALRREARLWCLRRKAHEAPVLNALGGARLRKLAWFNAKSRVADIAHKFAVDVDHVLLIRAAFDKLSFQRGAATFIETADWLGSLGEPKSDGCGDDRLTVYQRWLVDLAEPQSKTHLTFDDYFTVVVTFCMLGQQEMLRWLFKTATGRARPFLLKPDYDALTHALLNHNPLPFKQAALDQLFLGHASDHGEIFYQDWVRITQRMPTLLFVIIKLQDRLQRASCGSKFWYKRKEAFRDQRNRDGVERTGMNS